MEDWSPTEYGFQIKEIDTVIDIQQVYYKGNYELRKLDTGHWLCRRLSLDITSKQPKWLVRFYMRIESKFIAEYLLTTGLK